MEPSFGRQKITKKFPFCFKKHASGQSGAATAWKFLVLRRKIRSIVIFGAQDSARTVLTYATCGPATG
jgi:hypothetical protein